MINGYFKYSQNTINKMMDDFGYDKACMNGVYKDLEKLKKAIEDFYDEYIFYLSYWKSECGWHGWEWSKDDGRMKNMADITDGITKRIEECYALCLCGLGERVEEKRK